MRRLAVATVVVLGIAGCAGEGGRICTRDNDGGELCAIRTSGSYRIEGRGLRPSSDLVTTQDGRRSTLPPPVGDDGRWPRPGSTVGLIGRQRQLTVEAQAAGGERLHLTVGDD